MKSTTASRCSLVELDIGVQFTEVGQLFIMLTEYEVKIVRNILILMNFFTQLFGLWTYDVDTSILIHIKYNLFKLIYSIVLPCIVLCSFWKFVIVILTSVEDKIIIHSTILGVVSAFYSTIIIVSYSMLYIEQHLTYRKRKSAIVKIISVVELLKSLPNGRYSLKSILVQFLVKAIGFHIFHLIVLYFNLSRSSFVLKAHPYLPLFMYAPLLAIRFYENIFYGGVLFLHAIFKHLNDVVLILVSTKRYSELHEKMSIEKYCHLSDELDRLSSLHLQLGETAKTVNSIFDIQLGLWMILQLSGLIIRCFFQYVDIVSLMRDNVHNGHNMILQNLINLAILVLTWIELLLTSNACDLLTTEVVFSFILLFL